MKIHSELTTCNVHGSVITIGNFDGLHIGHQSLLRKVTEKSVELKLPSYLLSFFPHPATVLSPDYKEKKILSQDEFKEKLNRFNVDNLIIFPFTKQTSLLSRDEFIKLLFTHLKFKVLVIGYDFKFGKSKLGNYEYLQKLGKLLGFEVIQIKEKLLNNEIVSSSLIRESLEDGKIEKVNEMLGDIYTISGKVVHGEGKGRSIGFPTINILPSKPVFLKKGVYSTVVAVNGKKYTSVTNFGLAPTIKDEDYPALETHILNFNKDLYGENVDLIFKKFIRPEKKFNGITELIDQIKKDIQSC